MCIYTQIGVWPWAHTILVHAACVWCAWRVHESADWSTVNSNFSHFVEGQLCNVEVQFLFSSSPFFCHIFKLIHSYLSLSSHLAFSLYVQFCCVLFFFSVPFILLNIRMSKRFLLTSLESLTHGRTHCDTPQDCEWSFYEMYICLVLSILNISLFGPKHGNSEETEFWLEHHVLFVRMKEHCLGELNLEEDS